MNQYIMFLIEKIGVGGHRYIPYAKYKIKKEDYKYYYVLNDKIAKSNLREDDHEVGKIINSREAK